MRRIFSIAMIVAGGVVFGGDPADFSKFSFCALPGTTIVASALFLVGLALWLRQ